MLHFNDMDVHEPPSMAMTFSTGCAQNVTPLWIPNTQSKFHHLLLGNLFSEFLARIQNIFCYTSLSGPKSGNFGKPNYLFNYSNIWCRSFYLGLV